MAPLPWSTKPRRDIPAPRAMTWRFAVALGVLALFVAMELVLMRALQITPAALLERLLPYAE